MKGEMKLMGRAASAGSATGEAVCLWSGRLEKSDYQGKVLVTTMTTPDLVFVMRQVAAIVTEVGGVLCHAAIVSRELGKPCVVGLGGAIHRVKSGDLITVDGSNGEVLVEHR